MPQFGFTTKAQDVVAAFPDKIQGRTFLITGASVGGLGAHTALSLAAAKPDQLILLGRTESKISPIIEEIKRISPSTTARFIPLDLASYPSVRNAASTILSDPSIPKIDVLINNAGIMAVKTFTLTEAGVEWQFGANHVGHFLLTNLLMPKILAAAPDARIVNVSSLGWGLGEFRGKDYNFNNGESYNPWAAYGQSKTANILFSVSLDKKLQTKGVKAYALHPGHITDGTQTNLATHVEASDWPPVVQMFVERGFQGTPGAKSIETGCATTVAAAISSELEGASGKFLDDCQVAEVFQYAKDPKIAEELWELSEELVGEKFTY